MWSSGAAKGKQVVDRKAQCRVATGPVRAGVNADLQKLAIC